MGLPFNTHRNHDGMKFCINTQSKGALRYWKATASTRLKWGWREIEEGRRGVERCPITSKARGSATLSLLTEKSEVSSNRENYCPPISTSSNYSWDRPKAKEGKGEKIQGPEERKRGGGREKPEQSGSREKKNEQVWGWREVKKQKHSALPCTTSGQSPSARDTTG